MSTFAPQSPELPGEGPSDEGAHTSVPESPAPDTTFDELGNPVPVPRTVPRVDTTFDAFGNPIDFVDLTGPVEYPEAEVEAALETARSHPTATGEAWAALGVQVKSD